MANIVKQQNNMIIDIISEHKHLDEIQTENMKKQFIKPQIFIPEVYRKKKVLINGKNKISKKSSKKNQKKIPNKRIRKKLDIKKNGRRIIKKMS